ncbi:MAG: hypothetical protein HQL63_02650 [Magnetococcales bacterium]|nr:hypothetical protein [Magnetococcales bacterium]
METEHTFPPWEERHQRWLAIGRDHPPEWLAAYVESPAARWVVSLEDGPDNDRRPYAAYLNDPQDLPHWAYALAKAYLDDVGEWPLFGIRAELALAEFSEHNDISRAVREILAAIHPVWPDVTIRHIGEEQKE